MKTLGIELTTKPGKGGVGVGGNGDDKINDNATSLILRMSLSTDSSTSMTQIVVQYDGVDNGISCNSDFNKKFYLKLPYDNRTTHLLTLALRTSSLTDSSTSVAKIMVEFDGVDTSVGAVSKLVKKLSKSWRIVKKPKKPQMSEKIIEAIGLQECLPKY